MGMSLLSTLERQKKEDPCEFKIILTSIKSSRLALAIISYLKRKTPLMPE